MIRLDRLDLLDRDGARVGLEVHQAAERAEVLRLVVDEGRVLLPRPVVAGADRPLEAVDRLRVEEVVLASGPVLVLAAGRQALVDDGAPRREPALVPHAGLLGHRVDPDPADAARGPGEVLVHEVLGQADGLEDLGAVVALDRRDPHLGDHLDDPLGDGLRVLPLRLLGVAGDHPEPDEVVEGLEGEVRVHRARAVGDEEREVVDLARLARLEDEPDAGARPLVDQVVVDRREGEERGDRRVLGVVAAVGEDDEVEPLRDRPARRGRAGPRSPSGARRRRSA